MHRSVASRFIAFVALVLVACVRVSDGASTVDHPSGHVRQRTREVLLHEPIDTFDAPHFSRTHDFGAHTARLFRDQHELRHLTSRQFLVHVRNPSSTRVEEEINALLDVLVAQKTGEENVWHLGQYLLHNTYVLVAPEWIADELVTLVNKGGKDASHHILWVGHLSPHHRLAPSLRDTTERMRLHRHRLIGHQTVDGHPNNGLLVVLAPEHVHMHGERVASADESCERLARSWQSSLRAVVADIDKNWSVSVVKASSRKMDVFMTLGDKPSTDPAYEANAEMLATIRRAVSRWIADQPQTRWVEMRPIAVPHNRWAKNVVQSGVDGPSTPIYSMGLHGESTVIGCADTGIAGSSCFFDTANPPINSVDNSAAKIVLYDTTFGDSTDGTGHGTSVAGTLVGNSNTASVSAYNGIAYAAKIAFADISASGDATEPLNLPTDLLNLFVLTYGPTAAKIHSYAWGMPYQNYSDFYTSWMQDVDQFAWSNKDFLPFFPAGNGGAIGSSGQFISIPSGAKNSMSVGSTRNSVESFEQGLTQAYANAQFDSLQTRVCSNDTILFNDNSFCQSFSRQFFAPCFDDAAEICDDFSDVSDCCDNDFMANRCCFETMTSHVTSSPELHDADVVSTFSGRGPMYDMRYKPDLVAPGEFIFSASTESCAVTGAAGTSLASSVAASTALLVQQFYESGIAGPSISPSASLIKATMIASSSGAHWVDRTGGDNYIQLHPDGRPSYTQGFGRVQLDRVFSDSDSNTTFIYDDSKTISTFRQRRRYCIRPKSTSEITATLVWTDRPASVLNYVSLINDLDLAISDENGLLFHSNDGETFDMVNNVERVVINTPRVGSYLGVQVFGARIPGNAQPYSIVITGDFEHLADDDCPQTCPNGCSLRGTCKTPDGTCTCQAGYSGIDCSQILCPNNCHHNGQCDTTSGTCVCHPRFSGRSCGVENTDYETVTTTRTDPTPEPSTLEKRYEKKFVIVIFCVLLVLLALVVIFVAGWFGYTNAIKNKSTLPHLQMVEQLTDDEDVDAAF